MDLVPVLNIEHNDTHYWAWPSLCVWYHTDGRGRL